MDQFLPVSVPGDNHDFIQRQCSFTTTKVLKSTPGQQIQRSFGQISKHDLDSPKHIHARIEFE